MFPILFSVGPLTIHTYGFLVALGLVSGLLVTIRIGRPQGFPPQQIMDMAFVMILWALVGSRFFYLILNLPYFREHPLDAFKIWQGGLVFSGGLIVAAMAMAWYARRHHLSFWAVGDLWAPALAIGQAVGRLGCLMAGCCYGKPTDLPWAVVFTHPETLAPLNLSLHPTQIYSSLSGILIFGVLLFIHGRRKFQGQVLIWYLILHSTARLFIERFRADERGLVPGTEMSLTQLLAFLILISAVVALFFLKPRAGGTEKRV